VDARETVYALFQDPADQVCRVRIYRAAPRSSGLALTDTDGQRAWSQVAECEFGPGAAEGNQFGFPEIHAMAADAGGNLFLADKANALIWRMRPTDAGHRFEPVVGQAGTHRLPGGQVQTLGQPILKPTALAVTGDGDLVFGCDSTLYQATAPGTDGHPWQEALKPPFHCPPPPKVQVGGAQVEETFVETPKTSFAHSGILLSLGRNNKGVPVPGRAFDLGAALQNCETFFKEGQRSRHLTQVLELAYGAGEAARAAAGADPESLALAERFFQLYVDNFTIRAQDNGKYPDRFEAAENHLAQIQLKLRELKASESKGPETKTS
jgi:hypothetical protein